MNDSTSTSTDQILRCAYLACAGDGEVSEEEMNLLEVLRGTVNKLLDMRQAVEYFQSTGDLDGALDIYPPGQPTEILYGEDGISLFGMVPSFFNNIHEERSRLTEKHAISELLKKEAFKIQDPYLQTVACQICMKACSPGGVSRLEMETIYLMSQSWDKDLYESLEWLEDYLYPVLNGEPPIKSNLGDKHEILFAIARASANGDMQQVESLLEELIGGTLPDEMNTEDLEDLLKKYI